MRYGEVGGQDEHEHSFFDFGFSTWRGIGSVTTGELRTDKSSLNKSSISTDQTDVVCCSKHTAVPEGSAPKRPHISD